MIEKKKNLTNTLKSEVGDLRELDYLATDRVDENVSKRILKMREKGLLKDLDVQNLTQIQKLVYEIENTRILEPSNTIRLRQAESDLAEALKTR